MTLKTPIFLENDTTTQNADELRLERSYMLNGIPGVLTPGSMVVTQRGAGANMSVDVAAGAAGILGTENALQGMYNVVNDATVNLAISAADATNARWDAVIVRVRDSFYSGGDDDAQFVVVAGTPAASPQVPDLDALGYENYLILAFVLVGANATSITNSDILDARTRTAALGGTIVCTSATRPTSPYPGMEIYETDNDLLLRYTGSSWTPVSPQDAGVSYGEFASIVGANDFSSGSFAAISMSKTVAPPDWATTLHFRVDLGVRVITGAAIFTFRLTWRGSEIPDTQYSGQNWQDATTNSLSWRGSVAAGGSTSGAFQIQAKRDGGSGSIRQSLSHFTADIWFT
jgi:hypothetical protein